MSGTAGMTKNAVDPAHCAGAARLSAPPALDLAPVGVEIQALIAEAFTRSAPQFPREAAAGRATWQSGRHWRISPVPAQRRQRTVRPSPVAERPARSRQ